MATINANSFLVEIAVSPFSSFKKLVCEESSGLSLDTSQTNRTTKCGDFSTGSSQTASVDYSGVVKTDPAVDEVSYETLMDYWKNQTALRLRRTNPSDGSNLYQVMDGYISSLKDDSKAGDLVGFSLTFTVSDTSTLDFTP